MKGSERNQLCMCGSGQKRKKCEPKHPPSPEEMDALHQEALDENYYFHTDAGRVFWAEMRARSRVRAHHVISIASALAYGVRA